MTDATKQSSERRTRDDRPSGRPEDFVTESFRRASRLTTEALGAFAAAGSEGLETLSAALEEDNVRRRGLGNGLVEGLLAAQTSSLRTLAERSESVLEEVRELIQDRPSRDRA